MVPVIVYAYVHVYTSVYHVHVYSSIYMHMHNYKIDIQTYAF